ncbi:MAG: hypothetical protein JW852_08410 [Spirochaetales bacterium]|nr:hypothetical protein [Spirochaetales bacterium]
MINSLTVHPVTNRRDLRRFLVFPWHIYRGGDKYPSWVPPLLFDEMDTHNTNKNPFYDHAEMQRFIAYRDGKPVGRIGAIIDHSYNEYHESKTGFFGFLEQENDETISAALFEAAESWLADQGIKDVLGPMNPSSNHMLGLLINGFDAPACVMMPYNPPYYADIITGRGYSPAKDLYAYRIESTRPLPERTVRIAGILEKETEVEIRPIDMKNLRREVQLIREIYNDAWRDNWGFVPWTPAEMDHMIGIFKLICIPDLVLLAFMKGEAVGFSMAIPDINQVLIRMNGRLFPFAFVKFLYLKSKIDRIRVAVFGVKRKQQGLGIDALFFAHTYQNAKRHGIKEGEFSWILEENLDARRLLENWGAEMYRTYRIYKKEIG